jgi:hypothetical protein
MAAILKKSGLAVFDLAYWDADSKQSNPQITQITPISQIQSV